MSKRALAACAVMLIAALPACGRFRNGNGPDETGCGAYPHRVSMLKERGGRVDWPRTNGLIAYDRLGDDGFFDVYTMALDGSRDTCLTCGKPGLPQRQNGNPAWHPSGNYIVFQSEVASSRASTFATHPGRGVNNVLWVTDPGGREFHQITELSSSDPVLGVIIRTSPTTVAGSPGARCTSSSPATWGSPGWSGPSTTTSSSSTSTPST